MNKEYTFEDFKKAPIGTKVTFENQIEYIKVKNDRFVANDETGYWLYRNYNELFNFKDKGGLGKIIKIEEPTYTTVYEEELIENKDIELIYIAKKEDDYLAEKINELVQAVNELRKQ